MANPVVGQPSHFGIQYLDQNGQPMVPTPTPDAPPTWASVTSGTLAVQADGSVMFTPSVAGADTLSVSVTVGGKVFTNSLPITVNPATPVLTSVAIVPLA